MLSYYLVESAAIKSNYIHGHPSNTQKHAVNNFILLEVYYIKM